MTITESLAQARESGDYSIIAEAIPYFRWMGITIDASNSDVICTLPFRDSFIGNPSLPALHGGVTGAFLEAAAAATLLAAQESANVPKIINITIEYLRPGGPKDTHATSAIARQGRRIATVSTEAWQDNRETPIARAHTHFLTS